MRALINTYVSGLIPGEGLLQLPVPTRPDEDCTGQVLILPGSGFSAHPSSPAFCIDLGSFKRLAGSAVCNHGDFARNPNQPKDTKMSDLPICPKCGSEYTYDDGMAYVCPECGHEWSKDAAAGDGPEDRIIKDANGKPLQNGDTVTVIKDLKVKGSSVTVKVGTKVKNIRLVDGDHDIDCRIDGIGAMKLKSEFVKKV